MDTSTLEYLDSAAQKLLLEEGYEVRHLTCSDNEVWFSPSTDANDFRLLCKQIGQDALLRAIRQWAETKETAPCPSCGEGRISARRMPMDRCCFAADWQFATLSEKVQAILDSRHA